MTGDLDPISQLFQKRFSYKQAVPTVINQEESRVRWKEMSSSRTVRE